MAKIRREFSRADRRRRQENPCNWRTIYLGADVPASDIVQAVSHFDADLLGLSASQSIQLRTVRKTIDAVRSAPGGAYVKVIAGGFAFAGLDHLPPKLGADGYAANPATAVEVGSQLVLGTVHQAANSVTPCQRDLAINPPISVR